MALHDMPQSLKSVVINLWSFVTLVVPILMIVYFDMFRDLAIVWLAVTGLMLLVPPVGWIRPHPYSDFAWNRR